MWKDFPTLFEEMLLKTSQLVEDTHEAVRARVPTLFEIFLDFPEPAPGH